jgi:hypothetical protein
MLTASAERARADAFDRAERIRCPTAGARRPVTVARGARATLDIASGDAGDRAGRERAVCDTEPIFRQIVRSEVVHMARRGEDTNDRHIQFIPAEKGWLALFSEWTEAGVKIHADPVIAWCLGAEDTDEGHHVRPFGQAVIGASPWMDKADSEDSTHFFALVREEQLDPSFAAEIKMHARHSRDEILELAKMNREKWKEGHASWVRQHRADMRQKPPVAPLRIF